MLETGEFTPVGGEKPIQANVRIITATHKALREEAKAGRFRHDLLYRLRVIPIFIPPLKIKYSSYCRSDFKRELNPTRYNASTCQSKSDASFIELRLARKCSYKV